MSMELVLIVVFFMTPVVFVLLRNRGTKKSKGWFRKSSAGPGLRIPITSNGYLIYLAFWGVLIGLLVAVGKARISYPIFSLLIFFLVAGYVGISILKTEE